MADNDLKPYRVVREVGQDRFEASCCALMLEGYAPAGGPLVMEVVHPITGKSGMGFMQAMYRPSQDVITGTVHPLLKPC